MPTYWTGSSKRMTNSIAKTDLYIPDHLKFRKRKRQHERLCYSLIFRWTACSLSVTCPLVPYFNAVLCAISSLFRYACRNDIFYLNEPSLTVKKVTTRTETTVSSKCIHCRSSKHLADRCCFRQATSFKCNKPGHIARVCRSGGKPVSLSKSTSQSYQGRNTLLQ